MSSMMTVASGLAFLIHGGYQVNRVNKKMGCAELALGVALVAGGYFLAGPVQKCNLTELLNPIKEVEGNRKTIFDLLNKTRGVTCDNFLPWKKSFHGDYIGKYMQGIQPKHLKESVMWGVDDTKRFFVAMKAKCSGSLYETVAFMFQRNTDDPNFILGGGHLMESRPCFPWADALTTTKGWTDRLVELFTNNFTNFYRESISLV